jgi:hypothetical protein
MAIEVVNNFSQAHAARYHQNLFDFGLDLLQAKPRVWGSKLTLFSSFRTWNHSGGALAVIDGR